MPGVNPALRLVLPLRALGYNGGGADGAISCAGLASGSGCAIGIAVTATIGVAVAVAIGIAPIICANATYMS